MIKKILSYFYPIVLYKESSVVSKQLEVILYNGKLILDSKHTNYSYGALQKVLEKGLFTIGKGNIEKMNTILVLGVAGGSIVKTLANKYRFTNDIIGVEIDNKTLEIANKYFGLNKVRNFNCIIEDAQKFIENTTIQFDLIVIDIFNDDTMPRFLFEKDFIENCQNKLSENGFILFNTMLKRNEKELFLNRYKSYFSDSKYELKHLKGVEKYNDLLIVKKLSN